MPSNPFGNVSTTDEGATPTIDDMFGGAVNAKEAADITKRNLPPQGIYITDTSEFPGSVIPKNVQEKDEDGEPLVKDGKPSLRRLASISIKGVKSVRGKDDVTTMLRFDVSPDVRGKKEYVDGTWTGNYVEGKDDLASRLWADAVRVYRETEGEDAPSEAAVMEFLASATYAANTFRASDRLMVLNLQSRRKR